MNIHELLARTGLTARQVRYLISEELIPPPRGGRANAEYGEDHVDAIRLYVCLREEHKLSPSVIGALLKSGQGVPIPIARGVTLVVDPPLLVGVDTEPIVKRLKSVLSELIREPADDRSERKATRQSR